MTISPRSFHAPSLSDLKALANPSPTRDHITPLLVGGSLMALGALMVKATPHLAEIPPARQFGSPKKGTLRKAAALARDRIEPLAPTNITDQIGRSLLVGGAALLLTRLLDEAAGKE